MTHLATLHTIVRAHVRADRQLVTEPIPVASAAHLTPAERRALAAWLRLPAGEGGQRPVPVVGSEEWAEPPAPGR